MLWDRSERNGQPGAVGDILSQRNDGNANGTASRNAVLDSVESLLEKLGQDPKLMQRGSKGMLGIW